MAKRQLAARNTEIQYPKELGPLSLSFTVQSFCCYTYNIAVDRVTKPSSKRKKNNFSLNKLLFYRGEE